MRCRPALLAHREGDEEIAVSVDPVIAEVRDYEAACVHAGLRPLLGDRSQVAMLLFQIRAPNAGEALRSADARASLGRYLDLYNHRRPHSSLDGMTPDQAYFGPQSMLPIRLAA